MPRIFDNIEQKLFPALSQTLATAHRADFCVGFFNLRGWNLLADHIERFGGGDGHNCRVLIGMNESPDAELRYGPLSACWKSTMVWICSEQHSLNAK